MKLSATEYTLIGLVLILTSFVNLAFYLFFEAIGSGTTLHYLALIAPVFYLVRGFYYLVDNIADVELPDND
jgi:4-hydroxybenzoate polyprenyltransferase